MAEKAAGTLSDGIALYHSGKYADALAFFLSLPADASSTDNLELAYYIALSYVRLGRHEDAMPYLEQAVTAGDSVERIHQCRMLLAVVYTLTNRLSLADYELQTLLESGYQTASVFAALAFASWEQNKTEECVDLYEKALLIDENNPTALNGLGYVLACTGKDLTRALSLCKKALDLVPDSAACLDSLAWIYFQLGLDKEAQSYILRAHNINADHPDIADHYRKIMNKAGGSDRTAGSRAAGKKSSRGVRS